MKLFVLTLIFPILAWGAASDCLKAFEVLGIHHARYTEADRLLVEKNLNEKFIKEAFFNAKSEGDPQITFLEKLGFAFDAKKQKITAPDLNSAFQKLDGEIDALIKAKRVDPNKVMRPLLLQPAGDELLAETRLLELKAKGFFPIGHPSVITVGDLNLFVHDLGHWGAMIRNPDLMEADMRVSQKLLRKPLTKELKERMFIPSELLVLGDHRKRKAIVEFVDSLGLGKSPVPTGKLTGDKIHARTFDEFFGLLKNKNFEELQEIHRKIISRHRDFQNNVGGAVSDGVHSRVTISVDGRTEGMLNLADRYPQHRYTMNGKEYSNLGDNALRQTLSLYLSALEHSAQITPGEFLEAAVLSSKEFKRSKVYQLICESGAYNVAKRKDKGELFSLSFGRRHYDAYCK